MKRSVIINIVVVLIAALLVFTVVKDAFIKFGVENGVRSVTGLRLDMKGLRVGVLKTFIDVKALKLYNPKGFKDKVMLDMPGLYVDYDLAGFFKGEVHITDMKLDLKEFLVVKNEKGELNLDSLKVVKEGKEKEAKPAKEGKAPAFRVDNLELKVGRVIYKDYSKGAEPEIKEYNVNIDDKYQNITDPAALVSLILMKSLANTTISQLTNFDVNSLKSNLTDMLSNELTKSGGKVGEALKGMTKGLFGN